MHKISKNRINFQRIARDVARITGCDQNDIKFILRETCRYLLKMLCDGFTISVHGYFHFGTKITKQRKRYSIHDGTNIVSRSKMIPYIKFGRILKDGISEDGGEIGT